MPCSNPLVVPVSRSVLRTTTLVSPSVRRRESSRTPSTVPRPHSAYPPQTGRCESRYFLSSRPTPCPHHPVLPPVVPSGEGSLDVPTAPPRTPTSGFVRLRHSPPRHRSPHLDPRVQHPYYPLLLYTGTSGPSLKGKIKFIVREEVRLSPITHLTGKR